MTVFGSGTTIVIDPPELPPVLFVPPPVTSPILTLPVAGPPGAAGADGDGVPAGGATNQVLAKRSDADNDTEWVDPPESLPPGGATGQVLTKLSDTDGDADWENPTATVSTFVFEQGVPSDTWEIDHPLGTRPTVVIVDSANNEVFGAVSYPTLNHVTISFTFAFSGTAYLI
jgi:hypothetical protein